MEFNLGFDFQNIIQLVSLLVLGISWDNAIDHQ